MRRQTMDKLPQLANRRDKLHVLPHGFVLNQTSKTTRPSTKAAETTIFLRLVSAGRFVEKKGFAVLIAAAKSVRGRWYSLPDNYLWRRAAKDRPCRTRLLKVA